MYPVRSTLTWKRAQLKYVPATFSHSVEQLMHTRPRSCLYSISVVCVGVSRVADFTVELNAVFAEVTRLETFPEQQTRVESAAFKKALEKFDQSVSVISRSPAGPRLLA